MSINVKLERFSLSDQKIIVPDRPLSELGKECTIAYLSRKQHETSMGHENAYKAGIIAKANGDLELAIQNFSSAVQFDPTNQDSLYMRATCFKQAGHLHGAIGDLEEIIRQIDMREVRTYGQTGILLNHVFPVLTPFEIQVLKEAAEIHLQLENIRQAMSLTLKGMQGNLQFNIQSTDFHLLSAKIYLHLGDLSRTREEIHKILAIQPDHPEAPIFLQKLENRGASMSPPQPKQEEIETTIQASSEEPQSGRPCQVQ